MAIVTIDAEDIIRGEDREFQFYYTTALPTGAAAWAYSLTLTQTKGGVALITKTFGAADYNAGTERWNFTILAASTSTLTYGRVTYGLVRRTDSGYNKALYSFTCQVG